MTHAALKIKRPRDRRTTKNKFLLCQLQELALQPLRRNILTP